MTSIKQENTGASEKVFYFKRGGVSLSVLSGTQKSKNGHGQNGQKIGQNGHRKNGQKGKK